MSPVHILHPISNHIPQDPASLHGFWAYFGLCSVIGIASAALLYSLYSCYHSAGVRERARIRNTSVEDLEAKEEVQRDVDLRGKQARSSGVWSKFYRKRPESSVEAMSPILRQSTVSLHSSQLPPACPSTPDLIPTGSINSTYPSFNSPTLSPLPAAYEPTRDRSNQSKPSSPTIMQLYSESLVHVHPPTLRPGLGNRTTIFDRNSIPFIASEQLVHHLIDPKLAPIGGSFSMFANSPATTLMMHDHHPSIPITPTSLSKSESKRQLIADHDLCSTTKRQQKQKFPSGSTLPFGTFSRQHHYDRNPQFQELCV